MNPATPFLVSLAVLGAAQDFANGRMETRQVARELEQEIRIVAARGGVSWIGYRAPLVAGPRQICCGDRFPDAGGAMCHLESGGGLTLRSDVGTDGAGSSRVALEAPTEFLILARIEGGAVTRVRTFTPECNVDAEGMAVVWLSGVKPEDSVAWLTMLATSAAEPGERRERVAKPAVTAIALHNTPAADSALESLVAPSEPEWLRSDTAFWLGSARGEPGARLLARMIQQDPSDKVRDKAAFGLSASKSPSALRTLITAAREDKSARVRGQALFWLAQKAGREAIAALTDAIDRDPETEVKKKAVFALSQLPKDEGVPKLIEVARTNRNPAVRRQAMFWLGQSKDARAVEFFEEVLSKK